MSAPRSAVTLFAALLPVLAFSASGVRAQTTVTSERPAMAAIGPLGRLESHDTFARRFGTGRAREAAE